MVLICLAHTVPTDHNLQVFTPKEAACGWLDFDWIEADCCLDGGGGNSLDLTRSSQSSTCPFLNPKSVVPQS